MSNVIYDLGTRVVPADQAHVDEPREGSIFGYDADEGLYSVVWDDGELDLGLESSQFMAVAHAAPGSGGRFLDRIVVDNGALDTLPPREFAQFLARHGLELVHKPDGLHVRRCRE